MPAVAINEKDTVNTAIDFMTKNIVTRLKLQQLATHVNISPSHFSFLFKKKRANPR